MVTEPVPAVSRGCAAGDSHRDTVLGSDSERCILVEAEGTTTLRCTRRLFAEVGRGAELAVGGRSGDTGDNTNDVFELN